MTVGKEHVSHGRLFQCLYDDATHSPPGVSPEPHGNRRAHQIFPAVLIGMLTVTGP
jgi:hypothetical protein